MAHKDEQVVRQLLSLSTTDHRLASLRGFREIERIGSGGMGAVFLLAHDPTGRRAAIKVLREATTLDELARESFRREIINCTALDHPHVVRVHAGDEVDGHLFLLMDYYPLGSLDRLLSQHDGVLPITEAMPILDDVLSGLDHAHRAEVSNVQLWNGLTATGHGLVHRDLKPQNVFLRDEQGALRAVVGDLGLAKAYELAGLSGITRSGFAAGTPQYMPRHQLIDFRNAGPEVDVWAAAACLYVMLTGAPPRTFPRNADPWLIVRDTPPVPIRRRNEGIPLELAEVIDHALDDAGELHFRDAPALRAALRGSCPAP